MNHTCFTIASYQKECRHHKKRAFGWVPEQYGIMNSISSSSSSLIQSIRLLCSLMQFPYRHFIYVNLPQTVLHFPAPDRLRHPDQAVPRQPRKRIFH